MKLEPWRRTPDGEVDVQATDGSWVRMPPGSLPSWDGKPGEVPYGGSGQAAHDALLRRVAD